MAREEAQQTRQKKHGSNPGTFSPDDDEAQAADVTRADQAAEGQSGRQQREARRGSQPDENIGQTDGEDVDEGEAGDEDESDQISQRP